jgi:thiol:disulfide interchange protein
MKKLTEPRGEGVCDWELADETNESVVTMTSSEAQYWCQDHDHRIVTVSTRHSTEQETDRKDKRKEVGAKFAETPARVRKRESENKAKANGNENGNPYLRVGGDASEGMYKTRQETIMYARSRLHDHAVREEKKT